MNEQREGNKIVTLVLKTMPISTNLLHGVFRGRKLLTVRGRENKESMAWEARMQFKGTPAKGPLKVEVMLWWKDKRNHDVDNIKSLLDALTGIVWEDDGQIVDLRIMKGCDKDNPRVRIWVSDAYE